MKKIVTLLVIFCLTQFSFAQSCALYSIKYTGSVSVKSLKIEKIKLPLIDFLHKQKPCDLKITHIETSIVNNQFEIILGSPYGLTFNNSEKLMSFYKSLNENLPIILVVLDKGNKKEIATTLDWNHIKIEKSTQEGFPRLFEIHLNQIEL